MHTHTYTYGERVILNNQLIQLWRLANPKPTRQGCRLEFKGRVYVVVSSPKATWRQKSFLLREVHLFS